MSHISFSYRTSGEKFYDITDKINQESAKLISAGKSGMIFILTPHTSCGLTINESYDPTAKTDLEKFLKNVAPRNSSFIEHTMEGPDDSPSHMKSMLIGQSLSLIVEDGKFLLGTWQGIYLAEFRDSPKNRTISLKFIEG